MLNRNLLFEQKPLVANKALVKKVGLNESFVLQQIYYWTKINKKQGWNYRDGYYWTYNTITAWQKNEFPFLSESTLRRTFQSLIKQGYLVVGNYNKLKSDNTKWYRTTLDYFVLDEEPVTITRELAKLLDVKCAIVLQQIHYWINIHKNKNKNYHNGHFWVKRTLAKWHEIDFDYLPFITMRRAFEKLEELGILITTKQNYDNIDTTKWYTIDYDRLETIASQNMDVFAIENIRSNRSSQNDQTEESGDYLENDEMNDHNQINSNLMENSSDISVCSNWTGQFAHFDQSNTRDYIYKDYITNNKDNTKYKQRIKTNNSRFDRSLNEIDDLCDEKIVNQKDNSANDLSINPFDFLKRFNRSNKLTKQDKETLEYIQKTTNWSNEIINTLVSYVLKMCDNRFPRKYVVKVMASLLSAKVRTLQDIDTLLNKPKRKEWKQTKNLHVIPLPDYMKEPVIVHPVSDDDELLKKCLALQESLKKEGDEHE